MAEMNCETALGADALSFRIVTFPLDQGAPCSSCKGQKFALFLLPLVIVWCFSVMHI